MVCNYSSEIIKATELKEGELAFFWYKLKADEVYQDNWRFVRCRLGKDGENHPTILYSIGKGLYWSSPNVPYIYVRTLPTHMGCTQ